MCRVGAKNTGHPHNPAPQPVRPIAFVKWTPGTMRGGSRGQGCMGSSGLDLGVILVKTKTSPRAPIEKAICAIFTAVQFNYLNLGHAHQLIFTRQRAEFQG